MGELLEVHVRSADSLNTKMLTCGRSPVLKYTVYRLVVVVKLMYYDSNTCIIDLRSSSLNFLIPSLRMMKCSSTEIIDSLV